MSVRDWVERDHPRWPRGTPSRGGQFRDKGGGDWADRLGDVMPAGRYGSVATGQTAQCPVCGRTVKIVGTSGKLSTHNSGPGQRCGGAGQVVSETAKKAGGVQQRRAAKRPKNQEIKAPEPPKVTVGLSQDIIRGDAARERFRRWQDGAAAPGVKMEQYGKTRREWEIENTEREIKDLTRTYEQARNSAIWRIQREMNRAGLSWADPQDKEDWGYDFELKRRTEGEQRALDQALDYLKALRNKTPIPDQQGVRLGLGGPPRIQWRADELDLFIPAGSRGVAAQPYDPAHPLDVYGDLLHIEDDTWFVYQALDTLEQKIPPIYHEIVAAHLASEHGRSFGQHAGIFVSGRKRIPDLDGLGHLRSEKPRGWRKGHTFLDPDGVVSGDKTLVVAYTENTAHKRSAVYRTFGIDEHQRWIAARAGNPLAETQIDPSAMDHEFGHMLDFALGPQTGHKRGASSERLWRLVQGKVKREGGRYLSPYFKQSGDAGPEELWADAFGIWAMTTGDQALLDGAPHYVLVDRKGDRYGLNPDRRAVTWRTRAFATEYDIPYAVAFEIEDYFDRLHKEVQSGKRKAKLARTR